MKAILTEKNREKSRQLRHARASPSKYLLGVGCLFSVISCSAANTPRHRIENSPKAVMSSSVLQGFGKLGSDYVKQFWEESNQVITAIDYSSTSLNQFILSIGLDGQDAIRLKNGATISAVVEIDGKAHPEDKFYARMSVYVDSTTKPMAWDVDLGKLRDAYRKITGKELRYVLAVFGQISDKEVGERAWFYIIPAESFDDVKIGNIRSGMPVLCVSYFTRTNTLGWDVSAVIE